MEPIMKKLNWNCKRNKMAADRLIYDCWSLTTEFVYWVTTSRTCNIPACEILQQKFIFHNKSWQVTIELHNSVGIFHSMQNFDDRWLMQKRLNRSRFLLRQIAFHIFFLYVLHMTVATRKDWVQRRGRSIKEVKQRWEWRIEEGNGEVRMKRRR